MNMILDPTQSLPWMVVARITTLVVALLMAAACLAGESQADTCGDKDQELKMGFYAFFEPVSYSGNQDPTSTQFNVHKGFEADLLTGLEAIENPRLILSRRGIAVWDDIWLLPAADQFDVVGGGITILDSRTRDEEGRNAVIFTSGHINFRQTLLVRFEDSERIASHADLTGAMRVGALAGTTGEHRLLELLGLIKEEGVLVEGARVDTPGGTLTADGTRDYFITAAGESPNLADRARLYLPGSDIPEVVYLGSDLGESELLEALADGGIDAIARGEIGNLDAARTWGEKFVVTALDDRIETGGFAVAADDTDLAICLNDRINWLTNNRDIGYGEWLANPDVFQERAQQWNAGRR